jgi:hypothetical protein
MTPREKLQNKNGSLKYTKCSDMQQVSIMHVRMNTAKQKAEPGPQNKVMVNVCAGAHVHSQKTVYPGKSTMHYKNYCVQEHLQNDGVVAS